MENDIETFKKKLNEFDWFFEYSDSPFVWERGQKDLNELKEKAKELDTLHKTTIFNDLLNKSRNELF